MAHRTEDAASDSQAGSLGFVALLGSGDPEGGSRAEQVAHQLETAIAVGLLSHGDRLPSESELAGQLGVSTITLRQGLAILRAKSLIATRPGRGGGSIVRDAAVMSPEDVQRRLRERSTEELRDLGDVSAAVAGASARLAALRADDEDVRRLRSLAEEFSSTTDPEALRRADSRLHIGLGIAAQSRRLTTATVQVQGEFAPLLWMPSAPPARAEGAVEDHHRIVDRIAAGDADGALALAVAHCERDAEFVIDAHLELVMSQGAQRPPAQ